MTTGRIPISDTDDTPPTTTASPDGGLPTFHGPVARQNAISRNLLK
jgi:hypothetical protein